VQALLACIPLISLVFTVVYAGRQTDGTVVALWVAVRKSAILAILLVSLSASLARASSAPAPGSDPELLPETAEIELDPTPETQSPFVEVVRELVARLLGDARALAMTAATAPAASPLSHDGLVHVELYDVNGEHAAAFDLPLDGKLDKVTQREVAKFFSCRRSGRVKPLHPGVVAMLAEVGQRYPGRVIEIVSGFRGGREERKTSPHLAGRAIDLRVRGVKTAEVRDWLWATHSHVGIGYYPHHDFLHMDTRPTQHDACWTQQHMNDDNDYHPRWARRARDAQAKLEAAKAQQAAENVATATPATLASSNLASR
jgi:uncharacterized protein YcbK (DUF882 family)